MSCYLTNPQTRNFLKNQVSYERKFYSLFSTYFFHTFRLYYTVLYYIILAHQLYVNKFRCGEIRANENFGETRVQSLSLSLSLSSLGIAESRDRANWTRENSDFVLARVSSIFQAARRRAVPLLPSALTRTQVASTKHGKFRFLTSRTAAPFPFSSFHLFFLFFLLILRVA